jgi:hypothetical protein
MVTCWLTQAVSCCFSHRPENVSRYIKDGITKSLRSTNRVFALALFVLLLAENSRALAVFVEEQKLVGVQGWSVAVSGNRLVAGAPAEDEERGAAYVYRYENDMWIREQRLTAPAPQQGDAFGISVAINPAGNLIVVSAPRTNNNRGSAYVFRLGMDAESPFWSEGQEIIPSGGQSADFFGSSTAISDDRIVVGSPLHDHMMVSRSGAVYVYREQDILPGQTIWVEEQKLIAPDRAEEDSLGWSVAIDDNLIVAGATQTGFCSNCGGRTGAAYVFNRSSGIWQFEAKLTPSDGIGGDLFGESVSISGERIAVATASTGSVYVFRPDDIMQWVSEQKVGPFYEIQDVFPFPPRYSVAIAGDKLAVGASRSNTDLRGAAHLFEFNPAIGGTWVSKQTLTGGDDVRICCGFGRSLAISGERIVVGEPASQTVYIFGITPDSDADGVPDNQDQCPDTPSGAAVDANGCAPSQLDADSDGVTNDQDQCPKSDTRPTIIIGTCDSGVANAVLTEPRGCTITDEILKLASGANSHGQFVSRVDHFLGELQRAGILEPNEKNAVKDCASQSSLP